MFNFFVVFGKYSITCYCEFDEINAHELTINVHYHEQNTGQSGRTEFTIGIKFSLNANEGKVYWDVFI